MGAGDAVAVLTKLREPGKGKGWSLRAEGDRLLLRDPCGRVAADLSAEGAARDVTLPAPGATSGELRMPCDGAVGRFFATGLGAVRQVVLRGIVRSGPKAIAKFRKPARRKLVVGVTALVLSAVPTLLFPVALLMGKGPNIVFGAFWMMVFVLGLVEIARGRSSRREATRLIREAERAEGISAAVEEQPTRAAQPSRWKPRRRIKARDDQGSEGPALLLLWVMGAGLAAFAVIGAASLLVKSQGGRAVDPARAAARAADAGAVPPTTSPPPAPLAQRAEDSRGGPAAPKMAAPVAAVEREVVGITLTGACEWAESPRSVKPGELVSNEKIRVVREREDVVLEGDLRCDATGPGEWKGKIRSEGRVAAETRVRSFLIHANGGGRGTLHLSGSVMFDGEVLGVIVGSELLDASDDVMGVRGLEYPRGGQLRGWFDGDGDDLVSLSPDRRVVGVVSHTGRWVDQVRVIVAMETESSKGAGGGGR